MQLLSTFRTYYMWAQPGSEFLPVPSSLQSGISSFAGRVILNRGRCLGSGCGQCPCVALCTCSAAPWRAQVSDLLGHTSGKHFLKNLSCPVSQRSALPDFPTVVASEFTVCIPCRHECNKSRFPSQHATQAKGSMHDANTQNTCMLPHSQSSTSPLFTCLHSLLSRVVYPVRAFVRGRSA